MRLVLEPEMPLPKTPDHQYLPEDLSCGDETLYNIYGRMDGEIACMQEVIIKSLIRWPLRPQQILKSFISKQLFILRIHHKTVT